MIIVLVSVKYIQVIVTFFQEENGKSFIGDTL